MTWLLTDHLGSTAGRADGITGSRLIDLKYTPWGDTRAASGSMQTQYRFTGQPKDRLGLYAYGDYRQYDPVLGMFIQPDSIIPSPNNPLDWNRFLYARGNPVRFNDPTGHDVDCGIGDSYCNDISREYYYSDDWRKNISHSSYKDFLRGRDAYFYYVQHPNTAFDDMYVGEEKELVLQARLYSEYALHQLFEPLSEFMLLDKIDGARESGDASLFWSLALGLGISEWMSSDKGYGGGGGTGRTTPLNLKEQLSMEAAMADPASGFKLSIILKDPRWPASVGWVKMAQNINGVEIHLAT